MTQQHFAVLFTLSITSAFIILLIQVGFLIKQMWRMKRLQKLKARKVSKWSQIDKEME